MRNSFTPENNPEKGEWYWVDVNAIAAYAGGVERGVQPVYVEAVFGNVSKAPLMPETIILIHSCSS